MSRFFGNHRKVLTDEEIRDRQARKDRATSSHFGRAMSEAAEPAFVFQTLKASALERAALKSQPLDEEEREWLGRVLEQGEAAMAAVRSLIETGEVARRRTQVARLKHKHTMRKFRG
jgi:hypothetical protein